MFSAASDLRTIRDAEARGARGYVLKSLSGVGIAGALRTALAATDFRVFGVPDDPCAEADDGPGLSERELTMLETLARGLSNKGIGRELWITEQTVKFHLTNIYRKLGVENRTQAVRYAYEHRLVREHAAVV
jgi:DNA-binding NarL/FixJ family response regulator